jgi:hypothetical protein
MKVRVPKLPASEKTVRQWEAGGWCYELCQSRNGNYTVYAVSLDSDDYRVESAATIKACLAHVGQTTEDMEKLLEIAE